MAALGSTRSSERFCQVTDKMRLADVHAEFFETPSSNDCFAQEQTVVKTGAMSEMRTEPPDAGAEKIALIARPSNGMAGGGAARFPETGHSNPAYGPKPSPAVRCAPAVCLTCGRNCRLTELSDRFWENTLDQNGIDIHQRFLGGIF